jgi:hypothetical protein
MPSLLLDQQGVLSFISSWLFSRSTVVLCAGPVFSLHGLAGGLHLPFCEECGKFSLLHEVKEVDRWAVFASWGAFEALGVRCQWSFIPLVRLYWIASWRRTIPKRIVSDTQPTAYEESGGCY